VVLYTLFITHARLGNVIKLLPEVHPVMGYVAVYGLPEVSEGEVYISGNGLHFLSICQATTVGELLIFVEEIFNGIADST
jgi:hypothetical protein